MCAKPAEDARGRLWLCRFAEYVGVHQILHNVSVDSRLDGFEESPPRAVQQPVDDAGIAWRHPPDETIISTTEALSIEFLPTLNMIQFAKFRG